MFKIIKVNDIRDVSFNVLYFVLQTLFCVCMSGNKIVIFAKILRQPELNRCNIKLFFFLFFKVMITFQRCLFRLILDILVAK